MPSNHLILCRRLLLLPSVFPSIRVFSSESALWIRWPKNWSFSFSISPSREYSRLISFRIDWFDLLAVQGTLKSLQQHSWKASILQRSAGCTQRSWSALCSAGLSLLWVPFCGMLEFSTKSLRKNGAESILYLHLSGAPTVPLGCPGLLVTPLCSWHPNVHSFVLTSNIYRAPTTCQTCWNVKSSGP